VVVVMRAEVEVEVVGKAGMGEPMGEEAMTLPS
jgi:hypothetical protein